MNFKHGKFANLASKTHGSVSPEVPTSVISKGTSIEAPKSTNNTVFSSIMPLTYVSTSFFICRSFNFLYKFIE